MLDTLEFSEHWKNRIERDLASFGDPGATVAVTGSGRRLRAAWTMRGKDHEAVFSTSRDRGVRVRFGARHLEYGAFVAGTDMADLRYVARMILQASKPQLFVPTRAQHANEPDAEAGPALELLTALLDRENEDATRVIMVTGEAGAGKTRVLQELVRRRADAYLRGQSTKLLLYVNAQGRALARLNEALATELQDLKVGLTYHSVAVLARLGILIPVIDGFDELLGVSGYDDAFSSLAGFLEQLEGEGQLLASARSVYYEEEFLSRAGSLSTSGDQAWSHDAVRVHKWSDEDREDYLNQWARSEGLSDDESTKLRDRLQAVFDDRNAALAEKPLLFARMVDILRNKPEFSAGDDPLRALVYEYLDRERTDKLLDKQSRSLLSQQQFETLMCELAQEMWNQETRELDHHSVREVAEYVVESEGLSDAARQVVISRMRTFAFLARSGDHAASQPPISFEHELFFFYFLAKSIASQLASTGMDVRIVLSRSALPEDVAERVAAELNASGHGPSAERLQELLDRLGEAGATEWRRNTQVRENAGLLAMALLRAFACSAGEGKVEGCSVQSVILPGSDLSEVTLKRCSLTDVTVRRTDLASTRFIDCDARQVLLFEPRVATSSTRLELKGLALSDVVGIRIVPGDLTYDPSRIAAALKDCGTPLREDREEIGHRVSRDRVELLEQLMRAYRRANPICKGDPNLRGIFAHPDWNRIERLLVDHELIEKTTRATKGKPKDFLRRRFLPEQLMSGLGQRADTDPRIRAFWQELTPKSEAAAGG